MSALLQEALLLAEQVKKLANGEGSSVVPFKKNDFGPNGDTAPDSDLRQKDYHQPQKSAAVTDDAGSVEKATDYLHSQGLVNEKIEDEFVGPDKQTDLQEHTEDEEDGKINRGDSDADLKLLSEGLKTLAPFVLETEDPDALVKYKLLSDLVKQMKIKDQTSRTDLDQKRYQDDHYKYAKKIANRFREAVGLTDQNLYRAIFSEYGEGQKVMVDNAEYTCTGQTGGDGSIVCVKEGIEYSLFPDKEGVWRVGEDEESNDRKKVNTTETFLGTGKIARKKKVRLAADEHTDSVIVSLEDGWTIILDKSSGVYGIKADADQAEPDAVGTYDKALLDKYLSYPLDKLKDELANDLISWKRKVEASFKGIETAEEEDIDFEKTSDSDEIRPYYMFNELPKGFQDFLGSQWGVDGDVWDSEEESAKLKWINSFGSKTAGEEGKNFVEFKGKTFTLGYEGKQGDRTKYSFYDDRSDGFLFFIIADRDLEGDLGGIVENSQGRILGPASLKEASLKKKAYESDELFLNNNDAKEFNDLMSIVMNDGGNGLESLSFEQSERYTELEHKEVENRTKAFEQGLTLQKWKKQSSLKKTAENQEVDQYLTDTSPEEYLVEFEGQLYDVIGFESESNLAEFKKDGESYFLKVRTKTVRTELNEPIGDGKLIKKASLKKTARVELFKMDESLTSWQGLQNSYEPEIKKFFDFIQSKGMTQEYWDDYDKSYRDWKNLQEEFNSNTGPSNTEVNVSVYYEGDNYSGEASWRDGWWSITFDKYEGTFDSDSDFPSEVNVGVQSYKGERAVGGGTATVRKASLKRKAVKIPKSVQWDPNWDPTLNNVGRDDLIDLCKANGIEIPDLETDGAIQQMREKILKISSLKRKANDPIKKNIDLGEGIVVGVEWLKGDTRKYKDGYEALMHADYGYIKNTKGADDEEQDVYLGENPENAPVIHKITQLNDEGDFDEHKFMVGFSSEKEAVDMYLQHMPVEKFGGSEELDWSDFKRLMYDHQD